MKITRMKQLLTAVACLFGVMTAQAQFTATYEPIAASDWGNEKPVNFSLTEVATTLGTDTINLVAALNSWTAEGSTDENMFFLTTADGPSDNYTQGGKGGFWVNAEGLPQAWSDDNSALRWFNMIGWDAANDVFSITIGQYPGQCSAGDTFKPNFILKHGGKEATFDITISIQEPPTYDIPEPQLLWQKLNVVSNITVDVDQKPFTTWSSSSVTVDLTEALGKLSIDDPELVANKLKDMLFATRYFLGDDVALGAFKHDSLTNESSAGGIGFWLQAFDNQEEAEAIECGRNVYGNQCHFYLENFGFDAETGVLSCALGQMPNALEGGKQYFTLIYLIYGEKAVCIRYNLNVEKVERGTISEYEIVEQQNFTVEQVPTTNHEAKSIRPDVEAITAALECTADDLELAALKDDVEFGGSTANQGGFWFNFDGFVTTYGSTNCSMYVEPSTEGNFGVLNVGQFPNFFTTVGQEQTVKLYILNPVNKKACQLNVTMRIVEQQVIESEFTSVAQRSYSVQQVPVGYTWDSDIDIPYDFIESNIGSEWEVYGMALLNEDGSEKEGNDKYTKNYGLNANENPGFWLNADGRSCGWGNNAVFAVSAAAHEGKFSLLQYPGRCNIGDVYKTKLFFVNEASSKMVTFNFTLSIVEEVKVYENVGSEDIVIPVAEDDQFIAVDLSKAAEALGVTTDYLLSTDNTPLCGITEGGIFSGGTSCDEGLGFNKEGFFDMANGLVYISIGEDAQLTAYSIEPVADDFSMSTQFCFVVENKQYIFNVKFVSPAIYSGIATIGTDSRRDAKLFDLSGRQVNQPTRGLYIMNGRKVVVK